MSEPPDIPEDDLTVDLEQARTRPPGPPPTPPGHEASLDGVPAGDALEVRRIGPYRIEGELGRGGMGVVWRGVDERLDRPVALKEITGALADDADGLRRFVREAKLLARLNHPHLATVHDLPESEGRPVLVMELLDGEDLSSRLKRGPLSVHETLRLCAEVASGLEAAHEHGIVHRDLKPANVRVLASGRVKVLDFGLALQVNPSKGEDVTGAQVLAGTPGYMSPEQVRCEALDGRSDLFALGIILYECLTGVRTYPGSSAAERFAAVLRGEPDWSKLPEDTTPSLRTLLESCLAKDTASRIATARELREALEQEARGASAGVADTAPADATLTAAPASSKPRHALPVERDEFVGRQAELAELSVKWEAGARLITVLGPGGMGKTRLVRRHAWDQLAEYPGGAWFCDLSEARTELGIPHAVASTLGVPLGKGDPLQQLGHAIAARGRCLIVLDNFEQVVEHAEACLGRWMERCAEARFVVTSRQRLELTGEEVLALEPLPLEDAAVELFELRARAQQASFRIDEQNRADVGEIVRLLDGLPLAIELAAARTRVLVPAQLKARLSDRFKLLVGKRGAEDRQSTLRAAIDWSWNMLEPWEKAALAQCSVFQGGFTLEAADEVLDLSAFPDAPWPLDAVQLLVDKSLLRTWTPKDAGRRQEIDETYFGMYVSIHEYAAEKLRTPGVVASAAGEGWSGAAAERAAQERHGQYFAGFGSDEALAALDTQGGVARRLALTLEVENLVTACRRAVLREDGAVAVDALRAAWAVLALTGPVGSACVLGQEVLALASLEPSERAKALQAAGWAARVAGRLGEAKELDERALAAYREVGNRRCEGIVLGNLGILHWGQGRLDEAKELYEQALVVHREVGDRGGEGSVLGNLGILHWCQGRMDEAKELLEQALAVHREVGNRRSEGAVFGNLGTLHWSQGRMDEAKEHQEESLAINREVGDRRGEGIALGNLGNLHHSLGRMEEAKEVYEQALSVHREVGDRRGEGVVLGNLGLLHFGRGRMDEAKELLEQALDVHREVGNRGSEAEVLGNLGQLLSDQGWLDEAQELQERALDVHREVGNRTSEGIVRGRLGLLYWRQGRREKGGEMLATGEALLRELDAKLDLGSLLCLRGQADLLNRDVPAARASLAEANLLAQDLDAGEDTALGTAITQLEAALADTPES